MKKVYSWLSVFSLFILSSLVFFSCSTNGSEEEEGGNPRYSGPAQVAQQEFEKTLDPALGYVPKERLIAAMEYTRSMKSANRTTAPFAWQERGPNSDVTGPSNGNTRANGATTGGRIRAIIVDSTDATHKRVFAASVSGGLFRTNDITASPVSWTIVDDFLANLAITSICQDPSNPSIMYFSTGEGFFNSGAVRGTGVFKSTNGGVTWTNLPSSLNFTFTSKILCDFQGNVYLATVGNGLQRSTDGGSSWVAITPPGIGTSRISDIEISTTGAAGRLYVSAGVFSVQSFRYTDIPATVTNTTGWSSPTTPYPTFNNRAEIRAVGNKLYSMVINGSSELHNIYYSADGGDNWAATAGQPPSTMANGQGWYSISVTMNEADPTQCIVGGLDNYRTMDGGATWTKISAWVGTAGQYVHADQHNGMWYDNGTKLILASDGGMFYSSDAGTTWRDRNLGLRMKQFYSIAIHPTQTDYLLAGAQDNGTHQLSNPGLSSSVEVTGGDGAYVSIDQDEGQYQFGAFVYNQYRRSINGGATWSSVNFSSSAGSFINPFDYDDTGNKLYATHNTGTYLRWNNPQTGNSSDLVPIAEFNGGRVAGIKVSPYTANRVYFGTSNGKVIRVDNADATTPTATDITPAGMPGGTVTNINVGKTDQELVACLSNYGVNNVWVSTNGGTTWTQVDGNLPDMPVRWALFHPDESTRLILATETGVWQTDAVNGASTVWLPDNTFPNVRTDMLKYRASDRTLAAGTYGRGAWSTFVPPISGCSSATISSNPQDQSVCAGTQVSFTVTSGGQPPLTYQWQVSIDGGANYINITGATSSTYTFTAQAFQNGYKYRAVVTANCGNPATSTAATLTLASAAPTITSQPANSTVCAGQNTSFNVSTNPSTGVTYQWQVSTNNGNTYSNVPGFTGTTINITNATSAMNGNLYRVVVSSSCFSTNSNPATLTVLDNASITSQPVNTAGCVGASATFTAAATGSSITYQWQVSTNAGSTFANISAATSATLTLSNLTIAMDGNRYRVVVSNSCSNATSSSATLSVNTPASIITQPTAKAICEGFNTSFSVVAAGSSISYQWQVSTNGGTTFTNVANGGVYSGATTATLSLTAPPASFSGQQYRVVVSGVPCGGATSTAVTLTVNKPPTVSIAATPNASITPYASTMINSTVTATGASTYKWYKAGVLLSQTTQNLAIATLGVGDYYLIVTDANGCSTQSNTVTITATPSTTLFIYPNPSRGDFQVSYYNGSGGTQDRMLTVHDSKGARVYSQKFTVVGPYDIQQVKMQVVESGVYTVMLRDAAGNIIKSERIIIRSK